MYNNVQNLQKDALKKCPCFLETSYRLRPTKPTRILVRAGIFLHYNISFDFAAMVQIIEFLQLEKMFSPAIILTICFLSTITVEASGIVVEYKLPEDQRIDNCTCFGEEIRSGGGKGKRPFRVWCKKNVSNFNFME